MSRMRHCRAEPDSVQWQLCVALGYHCRECLAEWAAEAREEQLPADYIDHDGRRDHSALRRTGGTGPRGRWAGPGAP